MQMRQLTTTVLLGVEKMSCSTAALLTLWHTALLRPHLETINPGLRATVISRWLLYEVVCNAGGWLGGNDHLKNHDDQLYRWIVGPGVSPVLHRTRRDRD